MRKFARTINTGDALRVTDVTEIPNPLPDWAVDAAAFIARMYPGVIGFKEVPANTVQASIDNGDGTYTAPTLPVPPTKYRSLLQPVVMDILNDTFGDTRYLAVFSALAALNTDIWLARMKRFNNPGALFTRDQLISFLTAARAADVPTAGTKITAAEITTAANDARWLEA